MIVDTNFVLRGLDRTGDHQTRAVAARILSARAGNPLRVLSATVLEVAFVLQSARAGYGWDRATVARAIEAVLDEPAFAVEHVDAIRAAARTYRDRAIDLHDCFLHEMAMLDGTRVLSFDADLRRLGTGEAP
ncbi:MAG: PIN domain-containing protein [Thermoleophilia bacterium]